MFTPVDCCEWNNKAFSASFSALDTIMIKRPRVYSAAVTTRRWNDVGRCCRPQQSLLSLASDGIFCQFFQFLQISQIQSPVWLAMEWPQFGLKYLQCFVTDMCTQQQVEKQNVCVCGGWSACALCSWEASVEIMNPNCQVTLTPRRTFFGMEWRGFPTIRYYQTLPNLRQGEARRTL